MRPGWYAPRLVCARLLRKGAEATLTGNPAMEGRKLQAAAEPEPGPDPGRDPGPDPGQDPGRDPEPEPEPGRDGIRRVTLKLFASLACYLPAEADRNSVRIELLPEERTALDLLRRFRVPPEAAHLLLVNGFYLDRDQRAGDALRDGDVVAIWPPVAGG